MKNIFFIVLVFFSICINAQQKKAITSTVKSNNLSYMKSYNDKYPFEVKLIEKKGAFRTRLQKLMGKEKFQDLEDFFNVESPITIKNNVMIAYGCMQHNCDGFYFKIFYDFVHYHFYCFLFVLLQKYFVTILIANPIIIPKSRL